MPLWAFEALDITPRHRHIRRRSRGYPTRDNQNAPRPPDAQVAELVDAQVSGTCGRKVVEVRVFSWAPLSYECVNNFSYLGCSLILVSTRKSTFLISIYLLSFTTADAKT